MKRKMNFDQQERVVDPALFRTVTILGVGSVGSQLAVTLAKEGCQDIVVWDRKEVSSHNPPMSEYRQRDLMRMKVEALSEIVAEATGVQITAIPRNYNGEPLKTAVACCVDDMDTRKLIWKAVRRNPLVGIFVDTRTNAEYVEVLAIRTGNDEDIAYYEHFIRYSSKDAAESMCGSHGAKHISGTAANAACAALTMFFKQSRFKRHLRMLCGHFQEV